MIQHPFPPLYDCNSGILILGSFPSVKSRETAFFYGHPQNRFWKVLSRVLEAPLPETITEKREFLLSHGVALWDVIASCEIRGSSDASIRNVIPNDLTKILDTGKSGKYMSMARPPANSTASTRRSRSALSTETAPRQSSFLPRALQMLPGHWTDSAMHGVSSADDAVKVRSIQG